MNRQQFSFRESRFALFGMQHVAIACCAVVILTVIPLVEFAGSELTEHHEDATATNRTEEGEVVVHEHDGESETPTVRIRADGRWLAVSAERTATRVPRVDAATGKKHYYPKIGIPIDVPDEIWSMLDPELGKMVPENYQSWVIPWRKREELWLREWGMRRYSLPAEQIGYRLSNDIRTNELTEDGYVLTGILRVERIGGAKHYIHFSVSSAHHGVSDSLDDAPDEPITGRVTWLVPLAE